MFVVDEKDVVCLDPSDGTARWRSPRLSMPGPVKTNDLAYMYHCYHNANLHTMVFYEGALLVQHPSDQGGFGYNGTTVLQVLSPDTGKELWRYTCGPSGYLDRPDLFGIDGLAWVGGSSAKSKRQEHSFPLCRVGSKRRID